VLHLHSPQQSPFTHPLHKIPQLHILNRRERERRTDGDNRKKEVKIKERGTEKTREEKREPFGEILPLEKTVLDVVQSYQVSLVPNPTNNRTKTHHQPPPLPVHRSASQ
jgi:hypothetical protein